MEKLLKMTFLATIAFAYFGCIYKIDDNLKEISVKSEVDIVVKKLENNRGYGIINDKYWFPSTTEVFGNDTMNIDNSKKKLFFRHNHSNPPRFDDLTPPLRLIKSEKQDFLRVIKGHDTIFFKVKR